MTIQENFNKLYCTQFIPNHAKFLYLQPQSNNLFCLGRSNLCVVNHIYFHYEITNLLKISENFSIFSHRQYTWSQILLDNETWQCAFDSKVNLTTRSIYLYIQQFQNLGFFISFSIGYNNNSLITSYLVNVKRVDIFKNVQQTWVSIDCSENYRI